MTLSSFGDECLANLDLTRSNVVRGQKLATWNFYRILSVCHRAGER
jgi:hypothetical protein